MARVLLLPPRTAPPDEVFARRHSPPAIGKSYAVFRSCLRWEFGFTCVICLLHECDIIGWCGVEGWGVTQVEHIVPQSHDDRLVGDYSNLLYVCKLCNGARSDTEREDGQGRRLLDPTRDVWSQHFTLQGDELVHAPDDRHAAYTAEVYNINDARKIRLRRERRECMQALLAEVSAEHHELARLVEVSRRADQDSLGDTAAALASLQARLARLGARSARQAWVPEDAPGDCRCERPQARTLPRCFARQCVPISL